MNLTFDGQQTQITLTFDETISLLHMLQGTSFMHYPTQQTQLMWDIEDALTNQLAGWERE